MRAIQEAGASMREAREYMDEGSWAKGLRAAERGLELSGAETHPAPGRVECQYLLAMAWYLLVVPDDSLRDPGRAARLEQIARDVRVKSGRYNQQVSSKCILVEVGHNANTLEQALAAMPYLARAIAEVAGVEPAAATFSLIPQGTQPPEQTPVP